MHFMLTYVFVHIHLSVYMHHCLAVLTACLSDCVHRQWGLHNCTAWAVFVGRGGLPLFGDALPF